ncbi:hypothetical protein KEM55_003725 [Ascosphaera atra]|nr:hypothetical protein KEM55_003725 [Ascosphaera atra]
MPTYPSDFYSSATTTTTSFVLQDARNPPPPPPPPPSSKTSTATTTTTNTTTSARSATSRKDKTSSTADLNLKVDGIYPHSSRPRPTATATAMSPHPHHLHSDSGFLATDTDTDTDPVLLDTHAHSPSGKDIDFNPSSSFWYSPTTSPTSPTLPHSVSASNLRPDSDGHLADSQHTDRTSQMMGVEERLGQGLRREESDSDMAYRRRKANRELSFDPNTFLDALKEKNERQHAGAGAGAGADTGLEDANGVHTSNIDTPTAQIVNGFRHLYTPADSHSYLETEKKEEDDHAATPTYTPYQTPPEVYNKDGDGDASRDRDNLDVDHDFDTPFHTPLEEQHHHHRNHFSNSNSDPSASVSGSATASAIDQSTSSTSTSFQPPNF